MAIYLDARLPKAKIVELYLNAIEFGPNIYGIKQASQYYFRKLPKNLSAKEGAFLGMLLPSPVRYSSSFRHHHLSPYARSTVNQILFKMKLTWFLSGQKYFEALSMPLSFETVRAAPISAMKLCPDLKPEFKVVPVTKDTPIFPGMEMSVCTFSVSFGYYMNFIYEVLAKTDAMVVQT